MGSGMLLSGVGVHLVQQREFLPSARDNGAAPAEVSSPLIEVEIETNVFVGTPYSLNMRIRYSSAKRHDQLEKQVAGSLQSGMNVV